VYVYTPDIWAPSEIEMDDLMDTWDEQDTRKQPEYDILYKQDVSAEDVYMNMGFKDASTQYADGIGVSSVSMHLLCPLFAMCSKGSGVYICVCMFADLMNILFIPNTIQYTSQSSRLPCQGPSSKMWCWT
jgi:hypothetical protein